MSEQMLSTFEVSMGPRPTWTNDKESCGLGESRRKRGARVAQSDLDLAWAAGLVDGEGSITVVRQTYQPDKNGNKRNPTLRLKLVIVQNDWSTLDRLQRIIGGQSHLNDVPWNDSQNRRCYQLQFDGIHALNAINRLAPFLYRKKQHSWAVNQFWKEGEMGTRPGRRGLNPTIILIREKWVARLRKLN